MTKYRMYDYWTLRFLQVDPKADLAPQESWTPYHYAFNNPIRYNDPYGDCPKCWEGLKRLFVDPIVNANRRAAEKRAVYGSGTSSGPTKNITGNYFGDAVYKLAGGETFQKALDGDPKSQFRVISGAILALEGGGRKPSLGDDAGKNLIKMVDNTPQVGSEFGSLAGKITDGKISLSGRAVTNGNFDFVVNEAGELVVGNGHQALSGGNAVQAAGTLKIFKGKVTTITNSSGHFKPSIEAGQNFGNILKDAGVDVSGTKLKLYDQEGVLNSTTVLD